uniref:Uncharacterized protein n=1 Tax=Daphnia galeata TaxID=27404 RepID=A0A8J2RY89_9CRUS|nr:unnamed protein product [Daphnia galeata]
MRSLARKEESDLEMMRNGITILFVFLCLSAFAIDGIAGGLVDCWKVWSRCSEWSRRGTGILWKGCNDYCKSLGKPGGSCNWVNNNTCAIAEIHLCVLDMSNSKSNNNGLQLTHLALVDSADLKVNSEPYAMEIIWRNVFVYIYLHDTALYGFYLEITFSCFPCRCANDRPSGRHFKVEQGTPGTSKI